MQYLQRIVLILILSVGAAIPRAEVAANTQEELRVAAQHGNADAQMEMGTLYEFGFNRPKDPTTALAWYMCAAAQGHALAIRRLDQLKAQMTAGQVEQARKLSSQLTETR